MGNAVIHFELMSKEPEMVSDFYAKIFGWKIQHHPEINYLPLGRCLDDAPAANALEAIWAN